MLTGYYTAASGMVTQEKKLNTFSDNIANASTVGYKADNMVSGTFGEHLVTRMNAYQEGGRYTIGPGQYMQVINQKYTLQTQGGFEQTGRPMDMSIQGDGFFVVTNAEGEELLTRDGQFSIDGDGYLVLPGFGRVQGENGDLQVSTSDISVDSDGNLFILPVNAEDEPDLLDKLLIAIPDDYTTLEKTPSGLYTSSGFTAADETSDTTIRQMHLERSNVNLADEMTRIIASQRALQSCSQIVKMYDELSEKGNQQITRV